jgi:hypothetical protein
MASRLRNAFGVRSATLGRVTDPVRSRENRLEGLRELGQTIGLVGDKVALIGSGVSAAAGMIGLSSRTC